MTQQEIDKNFDQERKRHFGFFLKYYDQQNWIVVEDNINSNQKNEWDVKLEIRAGEILKIDEKTISDEWNECCVELIQCIKKQSWGWYYGDKDVVLYGSWTDESEESWPSSL